MPNGTVSATTPIATTIVPQNPGFFALGGNDPRPGIVYHGSSQAFDIVDLNGLPQAGDSAILSIGPGAATYTSGNINVVTGTNSVTGVGTAWTTDMAGGRLSSRAVYTITSVNSGTSITLNVELYWRDRQWLYSCDSTSVAGFITIRKPPTTPSPRYRDSGESG